MELNLNSKKLLENKYKNRLILLKEQLISNKTSGWIMVNSDLDKFPVKTKSLKGKTLFITGASRGIGLAIALMAASQGANIAVVAKTITEQKNLPGTIFTAVEEINKAGGKGLAIQCDVRDEESVKKAVEKTVETFGGIDILINNASAISLTSTDETTMKKYDLMHSINERGTYLCTKLCLEHLKKSENPHILTLSPPLNIEDKWLKSFPAYALSKFGMSIYAKAFAAEFKDYGIASNALWPRTSIATAAVQNLLGGDNVMKKSRDPKIMGDAANFILNSDSRIITGRHFIDDEILVAHGISNLEIYNCVKGTSDKELTADFFC